MARFFFHVFDTKALSDSEGAEFPDWRAAQSFAIRYMGELLQSDAAMIAANEDWYMNVTNEAGLVLLRIDFSILRSSALSYAHRFRTEYAAHLVEPDPNRLDPPRES